MKILVLGGTKFLGRALVESALARGHDVALFTRGRTNPQLFADVERLIGDRDGDLAALRGREWDAVVDTSGYVPRVVRKSVDLLRRQAGHYTFVSSISVYADFSRGPDEDSAVAPLEDETTEDVQAHYGPLKARCEDVVRDSFGDAALVVRPGLIVGPHDPTGRFTYWPHRVARGGEVLAPGDPGRPVQFIDVRDLAEWMLRLIERGAGGVFNASGPEPRPTMEELLLECRRVTGSDASLVWVPDAFLLERGVGQWMELPLWLAAPEVAGMMAADVSRAVAAGLTFRPLADTVAATLCDAEPQDGVGLAPAREAELLAAMRAAAA